MLAFVMLLLSAVLSFTFAEIRSRDQYTQTAPQGMVLVQSDSVLPYYISVIEEPNMNWQVYVTWLREVFVSYPEVYKNALPKDTMTGLWQYYNDPFLDNYFEHPSFQWYPVTGVSWNQVQGYLEWKTDRLNEIILFKTHTYNLSMQKMVDEQNFNTTAYLCHQYDPDRREKDQGLPRDYRTRKGIRDIKAGDGLFFPQYRLPTEEEWELGRVYVQKQDNYSLIEDAIDKENPLSYWQEYYYLASGSGDRVIRKMALDINNFEAGVSEWLLDKETYRWQALENNYEILFKNGWEPFSHRALDSYGEIHEKDSLGSLGFTFVQISGLNQPLYMFSNALIPLRADEVYDKNPYYKKDSLQMDSIFKSKYPHWNASNGYWQQQFFNQGGKDHNFNTFLYRMNIHTKELTKDSLKKATVYTELESPKRKVKSGSFRKKNDGIEWLAQKSASPMVGFRCVLPFTGVPVMKGKKVKW